MASMIFSTVFIIVTLAASTYAGCTGNPPMFNGLPCATTTRYWDGQKGACGCGTGDTNPFSWQWNQHTAAASQLVFDPSMTSWCGSGCGSCFEITPTGDCPYGGNCAVQNAPVTIMVTNLCPYQGNEQWCPNPGNANSLGYHAHFDLMDYNMAGWVDSLGWNNPVVTYRQVPCGGGGSPSCSEAATCQCATPGCNAGSAAAAVVSTSTTTTTTASSSSSSSHASTATTATTSTSSAPVTPSHASTATTATTATTSSSSSGAATHTSSSSSGAPISGNCRAGLSFALSSSWNGGGMVTITISNTGTSPITSLQVDVPGPVQSWNLAATSTANVYTLPSWAFPIAPGTQYTSSGYTYTGSQPAAGSIASISC